MPSDIVGWLVCLRLPSLPRLWTAHCYGGKIGHARPRITKINNLLDLPGFIGRCDQTE